MDKHIFCIIHNELPICSGMVGWETWYPRRGLKLPRLVSSRMVLIWQAGLGRYMMRAKWQACAGAGPIKQWVQTQRQWYSQCPPFSLAKGLCSSSRGKILCFEAPCMENCRLLMRICSNASMICGVSMVHSKHLLKCHLYI